MFSFFFTFLFSFINSHLRHTELWGVTKCDDVLKVDIRDFNNIFFYEFKRQKEDHKGKELSSNNRIPVRKDNGFGYRDPPT